MKKNKIVRRVGMGLAAMGLLFSLTISSTRALAFNGQPAYQKKSFGDKKQTENIWKPKLKDLTKPISQVIVKFKTSSENTQNQLANKYNARKKLIISKNTAVLDVSDKTNIDALVNKLKKESNVASVEPDYLNVAMAQQTSWGYTKVNGSTALTTNSANGSGVTVAVLDTGVDYNHNELSSKIFSNSGETPGNGIDDDGNGFIDDVRGWDFAGATAGISSPDNDPMDEFGHGTHVSGIIAADNDSDGVLGLAPSSTIMPVRVLDDGGYGSNASIAAGIYYAVDNGADVINMSLGGPAPSSIIESALDYAQTHDVTVVAAAGNDFGWNVDASYPAAYPTVISVGATDENDKLADFSNWGKVDVTAPGTNILSTIPGNRTARYSGTSMATPFVAAEVALIRQKHPSYNMSKIEHVLLSTNNDLGTVSRDLRYGAGRINAGSATGTLTNKMTLSADTWRIISNDNSFDGGSATISAKLISSSGVAQNGETVNFTTSKGDLSSTSAVTNSDGIASVTLSADDVQGMATVTATHGSYGTQSIQIILLNNNIEAHEVRMYKNQDTSAKFQPSDNVSVVTELRNLQLAYYDSVGTLKADLDYQVLDGNGDPVSSLSGTLLNQSVEPNNSFINFNMTLPSDMDSGKYTLRIDVTDQDSEKISTIEYPFQVGGNSDILVVPLTDATVDTYNADYSSISMASIQPMIKSLSNLDQDFDVWPYQTIEQGDATLDILKQYPIVLFTNGSQYTDGIVQDYLNAGGNAYLSGNTDFPTELGYALDITGWCGNGIYNNLELNFGCKSTKLEPTQIDGLSGGLFDGKTYNVSAYEFGDGSLDNMVADELKTDSADKNQLKFHDGGVASPAIAGFTRDDGVSRFAMTGFSPTALDSNAGNGRDNFVLTILQYLRDADSLSVDSVTPNTAYEGDAKTITITGTGFVATGQSTVTVGGVAATNVTGIDRNTLEATLPTSLAVGTYDLTVTTPFGPSNVLENAVTISYRPPEVRKIEPYFDANNAQRTITIRGNFFREGLSVKLGNTRLTKITLNSSKQITAIVPKDFTPGTYVVVVTNSNGKQSKNNVTYTVRYGFRYNLSLNSSSSEVKQLEMRLKKEGYFSGSPDNYYSSATVTAMKNMQKNNGLSQTSRLDSATRTKLNHVWDIR